MCENYDNFIGTTYTTSRGGILTVVKSNGKKGQEKRYFVSCSICSVEFPDKVFSSKKSNLVQGCIPCLCHKYIDRVKEKEILTKTGSIFRITGIHKNKNKSGQKIYECICEACFMNDPELFKFPILRTPTQLKLGNTNCLCSGEHILWTEYQYEVLCRRKAEENNYNFLGFDGEYKESKTKVLMECQKHGVWDSLTISGLIYSGYGCPSCRKDKLAYINKKDDDEMINSFLSTGKYKEGTLFKRSDRTNSLGNLCYWDYTCPVCSTDEYVKAGLCSGVFSISHSCAIKGKLSCRCAKGGKKLTKSQMEFKLNKILAQEGCTFNKWKDGFKNSFSKFEWTCQNGHVCLSSVSNYINNNTRCNNCLNKGFNLSKTASLYIVEWYSDCDKFIKFGITNNEIIKRVKQQKRKAPSLDFRVIAEYSFQTGEEALILEDKIKEYFTCGVVRKEIFEDGFTETINYKDLPKLLDFISINK